MIRDDVIRMAREAGFDLDMWQLSVGCNVAGTQEELERFAALVAAHEREAVIQDAVQHAYIKRTLVDQFSEFIRARGTP